MTIRKCYLCHGGFWSVDGSECPRCLPMSKKSMVDFLAKFKLCDKCHKTYDATTSQCPCVGKVYLCSDHEVEYPVGSQCPKCLAASQQAPESTPAPQVARCSRCLQVLPASLVCERCPGPERQKWEYKGVTPSPAQAEDWLGRLGSDGWELVAVEVGTFYFKRPLP